MSSPDNAADPQTAATRDVVMRYHLSWKARDIDAVLALYHPEVQYNDFFQNRCMGRDALRDYLHATMPSGPEDFLEHNDRIRVDGDTAFIQYAIRVAGGGTFRASEAITVRDGLIWRINEYALLVQPAAPAGKAESQRPAASRLGLSARQLGMLARDIEEYFQRSQPYLDPALDLHQVAGATGYTRNQISYLLNQMLGQSFYQYVNQARLQHLLKLLESAVAPVRIDELAFSAGFNSLSAFYRCFRQHTGLSPKAYLKQLARA